MNFAKTILASGALLLLAISLGAISSPAQRKATQPQQDVKAATHERGPGQELAHETREAAGEDDRAQFKQSASVAVIARLTGLSISNAYLFSVVLNFVVVAGVIVWAGRKFLPGIFRARTAAIQKAIGEAQKASQEARRRLAEIESRLLKLDGEIGMMRDAAEKEAAAEEARIQAAAKDDGRKIVEDAQQEIASAAKAARRELTAYAADLAVALAEKQIRVDAATDQAFLRNFTRDLGNPESQASGRDGR
jgi:F-type H+-transporting ATPase subunit b